MNFDWTLFIHLGIITALLMLATFIRTRVKFFQRFLIPNALTAGFIALPLYNFVFPLLGLDTEVLRAMTYHLLSLSFVAMSLRRVPAGSRKRDGRIFATSVSVISQFAVQIIVGMLLTLLIMKTIMPEIFHSFGWLMPLGFAQGPGQAFAIGEGWRVAGIEDAGNVGLTFAAVGFLVSCFGGVFLINYGMRRGWLAKKYVDAINKQGVKRGIFARGSDLPKGASLTSETEAIDSMTLNAGIVLISYFGAYLLLQGLTSVLSMAGDAGARLATNLWGISFIFAALVALAVRGFLGVTNSDHILDNSTLNRVSGLSVDLMVTSAIGAISLVIVSKYWLPILILSVFGSFFAFVLVPWFTSRIFRDHPFHRMLLIFGVSTGTLSTGLALLRVIDPEFETPVASDYAYASGIVFLLVIPLILSINLPVRAFETGDMRYFWYAFAVAVGYLIFVLASFLFIAKKRAFSGSGRIWLKQE